MGKIRDFGQASSLEITVLVDNRADLLAKSTDTVRRFTKAPLLADSNACSSLGAFSEILAAAAVKARSSSAMNNCTSGSASSASPVSV